MPNHVGGGPEGKPILRHTDFLTELSITPDYATFSSNGFLFIGLLVTDGAHHLFAEFHRVLVFHLRGNAVEHRVLGL
jgi:hypothetical protein